MGASQNQRWIRWCCFCLQTSSRQKSRKTPTVSRQPLELSTKQAKRSIASVSLERFFDAYRAAWDVKDFHTLNANQLNEAIKVIEGAARIGRDLSHSVDSIWREHHDLRDLHKGAFEACLTSINAQVTDLAHFRTHYLGECPAEVMH